MLEFPSRSWYFTRLSSSCRLSAGLIVAAKPILQGVAVRGKRNDNGSLPICSAARRQDNEHGRPTRLATDEPEHDLQGVTPASSLLSRSPYPSWTTITCAFCWLSSWSKTTPTATPGIYDCRRLPLDSREVLWGLQGRVEWNVADELINGTYWRLGSPFMGNVGTPRNRVHSSVHLRRMFRLRLANMDGFARPQHSQTLTISCARSRHTPQASLYCSVFSAFFILCSQFIIISFSASASQWAGFPVHFHISMPRKPK